MQIKSNKQEWFLFVESHVSFIRHYIQKLDCNNVEVVEHAQKSITDSIVLLQYVHMNYFSTVSSDIRQSELIPIIIEELDLIESMVGKVMNDRQLLLICLEAVDKLKSYYPRVLKDQNMSRPWIAKQ